jgi:hypothetical protein
MLRRLITGRILVHPREGEAELEFRCSLGRLIAGCTCQKHWWPQREGTASWR